MKKEEVFGGYILEIDEGCDQIVSIARGSRVVKVGQLVTANGRIFAQKGARGSVVKIERPYANGLTSDVIMAHFEGQRTPVGMKFKDLEL
ncbi:MAG: hypothetical protein Q8R12_02285 [bacterium]|nr:hypothetical protein [bacterium]